MALDHPLDGLAIDARFLRGPSFPHPDKTLNASYGELLVGLRLGDAALLHEGVELRRAMDDMLLSMGFHLEASVSPASARAGDPFTLAGMFRVTEQKLTELPAEKLKELVTNGVLPRVYAHLMSMSNFTRLLARKAARARPQRKVEAKA